MGPVRISCGSQFPHSTCQGIFLASDSLASLWSGSGKDVVGEWIILRLFKDRGIGQENPGLQEDSGELWVVSGEGLATRLSHSPLTLLVPTGRCPGFPAGGGLQV